MKNKFIKRMVIESDLPPCFNKKLTIFWTRWRWAGIKRAVIVWIAANPVVVVSRALFDIRLAIIDSRTRWEIALKTFEQTRGKIAS